VSFLPDGRQACLFVDTYFLFLSLTPMPSPEKNVNDEDADDTNTHDPWNLPFGPPIPYTEPLEDIDIPVLEAAPDQTLGPYHWNAHRRHQDNQPPPYEMHLIGAKQVVDLDGNPLHWAGASTMVSGWDSYSYVFNYRIEQDYEAYGIAEDMKEKVVVHELGHQCAGLRDGNTHPHLHNDDGCVMWQGHEHAGIQLYADVHFCPMCVVNIRESRFFFQE